MAQAEGNEWPWTAGLIAAAVSVVLLICLLLALRYRRRGKTVILMGSSHAGKTALFHTLVNGKFTPTVTSQQANEADFTSPNYRLIDLPGHEKLRTMALDHLPLADGIIFVIDSNQV